MAQISPENGRLRTVFEDDTNLIFIEFGFYKKMDLRA